MHLERSPGVYSSHCFGGTVCIMVGVVLISCGVLCVVCLTRTICGTGMLDTGRNDPLHVGNSMFSHSQESTETENSGIDSTSRPLALP